MWHDYYYLPDILRAISYDNKTCNTSLKRLCLLFLLGNTPLWCRFLILEITSSHHYSAPAVSLLPSSPPPPPRSSSSRPVTTRAPPSCKSNQEWSCLPVMLRLRHKQVKRKQSLSPTAGSENPFPAPYTTLTFHDMDLGLLGISC